MKSRYIDWKGWQEADFGSFNFEDALYYAQELRRCGISSVVGLRVGELGYGNGRFAGWAKQAGASWVGREVISELQQNALKADYEVITADSKFADIQGKATFDLIIAFDVIEHLPIADIHAFLVESKEALKPGGHLVLRIPSGDSPFSGAIYHGDLTHRTLLGSSAVRQIAEDVGLQIQQLRSPALPVWGLGYQRAARRLVVHLIQVLVFSFVRNFLMGNSRAVVTPNMIVVLGKEGLIP